MNRLSRWASEPGPKTPANTGSLARAARGLDEDEEMNQRLREMLRDVEMEAEVAKLGRELGLQPVVEDESPTELELARPDCSANNWL